MIISLVPQDTTLTALTLDGVLDFPHGERRMSRTKLVTGGSNISNNGQTIKDRTANFVLILTSLEDEQTLEYWHTNRSLLMFSDSLGVYSCKIKSLNILNGVAAIDMFIIGLIVSSVDYIYPPPYVPDPWDNYTSDAYWGTAAGYLTLTWDGSKWSGTKVGAGSYQFGLGDIPPWNTGYRPSRFKITYTLTSNGSFSNFFSLTPTNLTAIFDEPPGTVPVSGQEYYIIQDADFSGITFTGESTDDITLEITKIEFLPTYEWLERTSDTYWESFNGYPSSVLSLWDGSEWFGSSFAGTKFNYAFYLSGSAANGYTYPWGSWADGFKPTKFSLIYEYTNSSGDGPDYFEIQTYPNFQSLFRMTGFPVSRQIYDLDWDNPYSGVPGDHEALAGLIWIFNITAPADNSITITKFELLEA